jgi:hypothetical protein
MTPYALRQMQDHFDKAEAADTIEARLVAYKALRQMIYWLTIGPI